MPSIKSDQGTRADRSNSAGKSSATECFEMKLAASMSGNCLLIMILHPSAKQVHTLFFRVSKGHDTASFYRGAPRRVLLQSDSLTAEKATALRPQRDEFFDIRR